MTSPGEAREIQPHVVAIDNTTGLLATLRDDPFALASCDFHPGFEADMVFAAPEGTYYDPDVRVAAYCGQHIIEGEGGDLIALFDQTGGYWTERRGYEPRFDRESLEHFEEQLPEIFAPDQPEGVNEAGFGQRLIAGLRQLRPR